MKPYRIIKSKHPSLKKKKLVSKLKQPKIPFQLFKNIHPPRRVKFYFENTEHVIVPSDVMLEHPKDGVKVILDQLDPQQS